MGISPDKEISESTAALQKQQAERVDTGGAARSQLLQAKAHGAARQKLADRLQASEVSLRV